MVLIFRTNTGDLLDNSANVFEAPRETKHPYLASCGCPKELVCKVKN
jgi:hypothetical protein